MTARHQTIAQSILETLRSRIIEGELVPRERLVMRRIATEFGCSEIPVREALTSLASMGYVEILPHAGASVAAIDASRLLEIAEIRCLLEPEATALGARGMSRDAIAELRGIVDRMEQAGTDGELELYADLNRLFHETILARGDNRELVRLIAWTRDETKRARLVFRTNLKHMKRSMRQHRRILEAIEAQDYEAVRQLASGHCRDVLDAMRETLLNDAAGQRKVGPAVTG